MVYYRPGPGKGRAGLILIYNDWPNTALFIMASDRQESALSEVIGFILILGVIALLLSIYVVYVVPAEGRQNEIYHMNDINSEFNGYKTSIDALIVSAQTGRSVYNTFTLSTQGITSSSGGFITFPLFQPTGSSGAILINHRTDNINIQGDVLQMVSGPGNQTPDLNVITSEPDHIYTTFRILPGRPVSGAVSSLAFVPNEEGVNITPISNPTWKMWLNATPVIDYSNTSTILYTTDLTISVQKNGINTLQGLIIQKNIQNTTGTVYTVDVIDPAYGLNKDLQYPMVLQLQSSNPGQIQSGFPVQYGYNNSVIGEPITMGSVEYQSGNNYFIQQNYYYQMGGIFLQQQDGMVAKIPPDITLSKTSTNTGNITHVMINEIIIIGDGIIGGTTPIQVQSLIADLQHPNNLAQGIPNARWVAITVTSDPEAAGMWNETFSRIRISSSKIPYNVPLPWSIITSTPTSSTFNITGEYQTGGTYDVELDIQRVFLQASLQRVGTILE
jgi:hypothetical protein